MATNIFGPGPNNPLAQPDPLAQALQGQPQQAPAAANPQVLALQQALQGDATKPTFRDALPDILSGAAAGFQGQGAQFLSGLDDKRRKAGARDLLKAYNLAKASVNDGSFDFSKIEELGNERKGILSEDPEADSNETELLLQGLQSETFQTLELAENWLKEADADGLISLPKGFGEDKIATAIKDGRRLGFTGADLEAFARESVLPGSSKIGAKPEDKNQLEIRKEVRKSIGLELKELARQEKVLVTNFRKIDNLAVEMKKGNRTATASAAVALVKLGDADSVVRQSEAEAQLNKQNPSAALTAYLLDKGTDQAIVDSVLRAIDPLNPELINVDEFKATARALLASSSPGLQESLADARERAGANLTESGVRSLFTKGLERRIAGLSDLVPQTPTTPTNASDIRARIAELEKQLER